jgi:hypothetical protein
MDDRAQISITDALMLQIMFSAILLLSGLVAGSQNIWAFAWLNGLLALAPHLLSFTICCWDGLSASSASGACSLAGS